MPDVDRVAAEVALEVRLDGQPFSVIMRTPGDDQALAAGFLFSESVIRGSADVECIESDSPNVVNAVLSRHNFILLGLRGQAKSRMLRSLATLLDPQMPYIGGCEIHDNPYAPICRRCRDHIAE